ncbi:MAG: hypothetical protein AAGA70_04030 [Pseudomonadota bacterium]
MSDKQMLRSACAEMTAYIAVLLTKNSFHPKHVAQAGDIISGWSISVSEDGAYLLTHELNLAGSIGGHKYALSKPTDGYAAHFASGQYDDRFDRIFQAYVGFIEWNQDVPTTRAWFAPPQKQSHILKALAEMGFLDVDNTDMKWTDQAGDAMILAGAWTSDLQSHQEIAEWEREKEARRIAKSLPSDLVFLAMNNPRAAFVQLHKRLSGDAWHQMADKRLIDRVIELIQAKNSN